MSDIKLGQEGSELTLPILHWMSGKKPSLPVSTIPQMDSARMSNFSYRHAFFGLTKKRWKYTFGYITKTQLDAIINLLALNQILKFKDENKDDIWYDVILESIDDTDEDAGMRQLARYICTITLREA